MSWWFNPVLAQPPPPAAELVEEFRTKVVLVHVRVILIRNRTAGAAMGGPSITPPAPTPSITNYDHAHRFAEHAHVVVVIARVLVIVIEGGLGTPAEPQLLR